MKTTHRSILAAFLVLGILIAIWLAGKHGNPSLAQRQTTSGSSAPAGSAIQAPTKATASAVLPERPPGVDERQWDVLVKKAESLLAANKPVEFHGRAVDQGGLPVVGARLTLTLEWNDRALVYTQGLMGGDFLREEEITLISDAEGRFELRGKTGYVLRVESLVADGYRWHSERFINYYYAPPYMPSNAPYVDPKQGVIFRLWRRSNPEALVPVKWVVQLDELTAQGAWITNYSVSMFTGRLRACLEMRNHGFLARRRSMSAIIAI
jgi:hypothetical protein